MLLNVKGIGVDVYLYEHDPQPGKPVADKIKGAIQDCDALVVLLTYNSQFSPYVHEEVGIAEASGKLIIPLVQPGIDRRSLAMLEGREYILFDFYNPENAISSLNAYLQKLKKTKEETGLALAILIIGLSSLLFFGSKK